MHRHTAAHQIRTKATETLSFLKILHLDGEQQKETETQKYLARPKGNKIQEKKSKNNVYLKIS